MNGVIVLLTEYLSRSRVAVIDADDKEQALDMVLYLFRDCAAIDDQGIFADGIWAREDVLPTGIGLGVAVPHVRSRAVQDSVAALAVLKNPVVYGSMDGVPVSIILLIAMPEGTHNNYLQYLARASTLFRKQDFRDRLNTCTDADQIWEIVRAGGTGGGI